MPPAGLLALVLLAPGSPPVPERGDELTYTGTVSEVVDRPGNRYRRAHELTVRVLVLEGRGSTADVAVLTLLRRTDDAVTGAVGAVTGAKPDRGPVPPLARLDLLRVRWVTKSPGASERLVHLLTPAGPPPLVLGPDTPLWEPPPVPLDAFAPFEFGMFPPRPANDYPRVEKWSAPPAGGRPGTTWVVGPSEAISGEQCSRFVMTQQTADWDRPVGGQTAWQRVDTVWVSDRDETTRKVHRVIRQRDGLGPGDAVRVETSYELKGHTRLIGRVYDRSRREVEVAFAAAAELASLVPDVARIGPGPFEVRLAKLDAHVREHEPTAYREAVLAVRRQLEAARRGEATPAVAPPTLPVASAGGPAPQRKEPQAGQPAPDFRAGDVRLADLRGKPVVLVFFKPAAVTTDLSLAVADALHRRYAGRVAVLPLVVFGDPAEGVKDRDRLRLAVPVFDGSAAGPAYGVQTFPRFVVIDAAGVVRWAFAGVGAETGYLVREQVDALLTHSRGTVAPAGTAYPTGPAAAVVPPRP